MSTMPRAALALLTGLLILGPAACDAIDKSVLEPAGLTAVDASKGSTNKSITISPRDTLITALDGEVQLKVRVIGANGKVVSNPSVDWVSLSPEVATVNRTGRVTAVAEGDAQITATSQGGTDTATVTVRQAVDYVGVSPSYVFLEVSQTQQLTALAWDANKHNVPTASFTWRSSDETVATVNSTGLVTAVVGGEVTITATAVGSTKSDSSVVAVGRKSGPPPPPSGEWDRVLADTTVIGDVVVPDGEAWLIGAKVRVQGNVRTVNGTVALRPGSSLTFVGGDPAQYVGGGMHYRAEFANDYGLWIGGMGAAGRLDIQCTPKPGWNRTGTDPQWAAGDEYWIAPTTVGAYTPRRWYPNQAIPQVDPRVPAAEVMNVTRDCKIAAEGAGHIHIHSTASQRIEYVRLEGLGVIIPGKDDSGRYALHIHMMGDASRGMVIQGVAAVNSRGRVFVPHASHGITFQDNVAVNSWGEAFWWDMNGPGDRTNDVVVDRLKISGVHIPREITGRTSQQSGIIMGGGLNMRMSNSAVSGVRGSKISNGFDWPDKTDDHGTAMWEFNEGNVAHNNSGAGIRFWFNKRMPHLTENAVTYRNGGGGILNGAYANAHRFRNILLVDDWIHQHSSSAKASTDGSPAGYYGVQVFANQGPALTIGRLRLPSDTDVVFEDCVLQPGPGASKVFVGDGEPRNPWFATFRRCGLTPDDIEFRMPMWAALEGSRILIEHEDGREWEVTVELGTKVVRLLP